MEIKKSEQIGQLIQALSLAQCDFKAIPKKAVNPYFNSKYAPLDLVIEATKEGLKKNGLAVVALPYAETLTTILSHKSGEWIAAETPLLADKKGPQGQGSAITYARRYALSAILNVASEDDDDGNMAQNQPDKPPAKQQPKQAKQAPKKSLDQLYDELLAKTDTIEKWGTLETWLGKQKAPKKLMDRFEQDKEFFIQALKFEEGTDGD